MLKWWVSHELFILFEMLFYGKQKETNDLFTSPVFWTFIVLWFESHIGYVKEIITWMTMIFYCHCDTLVSALGQQARGNKPSEYEQLRQEDTIE